MALFQSVTVLSRQTGFWDRGIVEWVEIALDHWAVDRDVGLHPSSAWKPVFRSVIY